MVHVLRLAGAAKKRVLQADGGRDLDRDSSALVLLSGLAAGLDGFPEVLRVLVKNVTNVAIELAPAVRSLLQMRPTTGQSRR